MVIVGNGTSKVLILFGTVPPPHPHAAVWQMGIPKQLYRLGVLLARTLC